MLIVVYGYEIADEVLFHAHKEGSSYVNERSRC